MSRSLQKALLTWLNEDNAPEINAEYAPEFYIAEMDAATEAIMREAVCSERKLRKRGADGTVQAAQRPHTKGHNNPNNPDNPTIILISLDSY